MWASVVGFFASVGSALAKLLGALVQWAAVVGAYFLGKRRAEKEQLEKTLEIRNEQVIHGARRPRDRSDVIDRMRDGDL